VNQRLRVAVLQRDGYACVYCGRRPPEVVLEADHVVPKASGGADISFNLVAACRDCNAGKSNQPLRLPPGYRPEAIGLQRRVIAQIPISAEPPLFLRFCTDICPTCQFEVMPIGMPDGDALSVELAYICPLGHQWHAWFAPELGRIHSQAIRYVVMQPQWLQ
jgi:hypothetical protein